MAINAYNVSPDNVIHYTSADFSLRDICVPVHLTQYEAGIPIIAIKLYNYGTEYVIPSNANANVRVGKNDRTGIVNAVLGCDSDRKTLFVEVTRQMTAVHGRQILVIEITMASGVACTGYIYLDVDRNPVTDDMVESTDEYLALSQYAAIAEDARDGAVAAAEEATNAAARVDGAEETVITAINNAAHEAVSDINNAKSGVVESAQAAILAKNDAETAKETALAANANAASERQAAEIAKTAAQEAQVAAAASAHEASVDKAAIIAAVISQMEDSGVTPSDHNHDIRYYQKTEIDNMLNGKAAWEHIHDTRYYLKSEIDNQMGNKAAATHDHNTSYFTKSEINSSLEGYLQKLGGDMTGNLRAASETTGISVVRNISYGSTVPTNLADGEIFIKI